MNLKKAAKIIYCIIPLIIVAVIAIFVIQNNKHAKIDEWSSSITTDQIELAEVSKGYGINQEKKVISASEYSKLTELLNTITEKDCSRKCPAGADYNDCNLALRYDSKLWLFKCMDNGIISLAFEDIDTATYYGCKNSLLYINDPELWKYIMNSDSE